MGNSSFSSNTVISYNPSTEGNMVGIQNQSKGELTISRIRPMTVTRFRPMADWRSGGIQNPSNGGIQFPSNGGKECLESKACR